MTRALLFALAVGVCAAAGAQIAVPPLAARVTDQTGTLTSEEKASLERTLAQFEARKGSQIVVLIVPTTAPETVEQYALRVVEHWKPGRRKIDDGALLLVAKIDRALRIEVGYGLEGALNDATSKRIISDVIVPRFKEGDFFGGIAAGVDRMVRVVDGEPLPEPAGTRGGNAQSLQQYFPVIFILALVVGSVLRSLLGRVPGSIVTGGAVAAIAWFVVGLVSVALVAGVCALFITLLSGAMSGRGVGGPYGGIGRGGFGGGGFGGGGFGGGGGGFGGGGASGGW